MQGIEVVWSSKSTFVGSEKSPNGYLPQWTVTAKKQLGPHEFKESLTIQQPGVPPVIICRDYELRVVRKLEQAIMWNRELAAEGMAESG